MIDDNVRASLCAGNNAHWCDAVGRAYGRPGEFRPTVWLNHAAMPRDYPNAVTLTPGGAATQLAAVHDLVAARPTCSVKDSFATLDLRSLGFDVLFEAAWLWRAAYAPAPPASSLDWAIVSDAATLARWEAVWAGQGEPPADSERIFPPALLRESGILFMAGLRARQIVTVAVATVAGTAIGLSNVVASDGDTEAAYAGAVALLSVLSPERALVGYERGDALTAALRVGFEPVGPLRVWARQGTP